MTREEYGSLVIRMKRYVKAYEEGTPEVSDEIYDDLYKRLKKFETDNAIVATDSPTNTVGSKSVGVKHAYRMLSIKNAYSVEDVLTWCTKLRINNVIIMMKYDGISCSIKYDKHGDFILAATRGNGEVGEDITERVKSFNIVPSRIRHKGESITVFGELVLTIEEFERYNSHLSSIGKSPKSKPRSVVATMFNNKTDINKYLNIIKPTFIPFNAKGGIMDNREYWKNIDETLNAVETVGIDRVEKCMVSTVGDVEETIKRFSDYAEHSGIPNDGLVVYPDSYDIQDNSGYTNKYPKGMIAYKFPPKARLSILREVKWTVGMTGIITPKGLIDAVEIDGSKVSNVSLYSIADIRRIDLHIGSEIEVYLAGAIIPKILTVVKPDKELTRIEDPTTCPSCGIETCINDGIAYCVNRACEGILIKTLVNFTSKQNLNITGLAESTIRDLVKYNAVTGIVSLIELDEQKLLSIPELNKPKYLSLVPKIRSAMVTPLDKFVKAIGFYGVQTKTIRKLVSEKRYDICRVTGTELYEMGVSEIEANKIRKFINDNLTTVGRCLLLHIGYN